MNIFSFLFIILKMFYLVIVFPTSSVTTYVRNNVQEITYKYLTLLILINILEFLINVTISRFFQYIGGYKKNNHT